MWYRYYVKCFLPPQSCKLPSPIPNVLKAYLRGTFRVFWGWSLAVIVVAYTSIATLFLYRCMAITDKLSIKYMVYSSGMVGTITALLYCMWVVQYYHRERVEIIHAVTYLAETHSPTI